MNHTPEPWVSCVNSLDGALTIEQDGAVFDEPVIVVDCVVDMGDGINRETGEANAKRIVECVNGCEGINPAAVKDMLEACKLALKYIRKEHVRAGSPMDAELFVVDEHLTYAITKAEQQ